MKSSPPLATSTLSLGTSRGAILLVSSLMLLGSALTARAATITVTSTADSTANDGACTLREAIINANSDAASWADCAAGSGADVINVTATGTITLGSTLPTLTGSLTINGPGASSLTVSGNHAVGVLVLGGAAFAFQNMTIADGSAVFGGGIRVNSATGVSVNNVVFSGNVSTGGAGGAIYNGGMTVTVTNSTFAGNQGYGGALLNDGSGTLTVTNSTFSGNLGNGHPGGSIGEIGPASSTTLTNVTVSASDPLPTIYVAQRTLTSRNSIIVNSSGSSCQIVPGGAAAVVDGGNNIDSGATCGFAPANGSMNSTAPLLGSLADNGGPTPTMALLTGSPAIDGVTYNAPNGAPSTDQRGVARPQGARYDIGAYEFPGPDLVVAKSHAGDFTQGQSGASYTITVTNSGAGATAGVVTVVDTLPAGLTPTGISGTGWTCTLATLTCTRSDSLAPGDGYPAITLTVDVSPTASSPLTNAATVSGGADVDPTNNSASDQTTVNALIPALSEVGIGLMALVILLSGLAVMRQR